MHYSINIFWSQRNLNDAADYLKAAVRTFDLRSSCRRLLLVNVVGDILVARQVGVSPGIYAFNSQGAACNNFEFEELSPRSAMLDGKMLFNGNSGGRIRNTVIGCGNSQQVIQASGIMSVSFGAGGAKVEITGADNRMLSQRNESVEVIVVLPEMCNQFTVRNCHMRFANMASDLTIDYRDCTSVPLTLPDVM